MNEQNKKLETLKKRCVIANKVVSVFQIIIIVGTVIAFIAGIYLFTKADEVNPQIHEGIEAGYLDITDYLNSVSRFRTTIPQMITLTLSESHVLSLRVPV